MKTEQIINDWKLITEEYNYKLQEYVHVIDCTFKLLHIPRNKIVKTFTGSVTMYAGRSEVDEGVTGVRFSEDEKHLICTADYSVIGTYLLDDFLK